MIFTFERKYQADLENIKSGVYLIRIYTKEGVTMNKFVKL